MSFMHTKAQAKTSETPLPFTITYPEDLPVSARRADIAQAINDHQLVIVSGETGSGKTTQIPKICLELGRGRDKAIGHTQPRRMAATSVAQRIADELQTPLGRWVGYQIRFDDKSRDDTAIKLMTDGISLMAVSSLLLRSEEHTSELQSRGHLVCRLLLDKKKEDALTSRHQKNVEAECNVT